MLPGLGNFTILDPHDVKGEDAGNNFFLSADSIGQNRGEVAARLLLEMNHDVRGESRQETVDQVLASEPDFFSRFQLVVACDLSEKTVATVSSVCWQANIPLMLLRSAGFLGYIRLQLKEHVVVEAHPDNQAPDLRLDQAWPALHEWLDNQALAMDTMSLKDHGHTPYPVLVFRALQEWRQGHSSPPGNYREKRELKEKILAAMRKREGNEEVFEDEENFEEAGRAVNTVVAPTVVPSATREILDDPAAETISASSSSFWVLAHALREFVAREGRLPVSGVIPDMFSDSERFIQLQNIYREKAGQDVEQVGRKVSQVLESLGRSTETIQEAEVRRFCKESRHLRVQRGSRVAEEFTTPGTGDW